MELLRATSRTFFVPIVRLPGDLRQAVASGYLCMRAIDEIEDHPSLPAEDKVRLLRQIGQLLHAAQEEGNVPDLSGLFRPYGEAIPSVTRLLAQHARLAPDSSVRLIWRSTAEMAVRMAFWVQRGWKIVSEADLDDYTFDVAGRVGLMLNGLWHWYDNTKAHAELAVGFGRGLQAVNILRNRSEDAARGVDFFPERWSLADMERYTRRQLAMGEEYLRQLPDGPALDFCRIPLRLAQATLESLAAGQAKLTRARVEELIETCGREASLPGSRAS